MEEYSLQNLIEPKLPQQSYEFRVCVMYERKCLKPVDLDKKPTKNQVMFRIYRLCNKSYMKRLLFLSSFSVKRILYYAN